MNRRAQQEIVGFVLIVVIVMIAMMVFLIISVSDSDDGAPSAKVSNMLDVLMKKTTECAIVYEPDYDNFEDLVKSCYKEDSCANLDVSACEYLNESMQDVVSSMVLSDASTNGWNMSFSHEDEEGSVGILRWGEGNCTRWSNGAMKTIVSNGENLVVRMRIC